MSYLATAILKFFKGFLLKFLTTAVLEKLLIEVLGVLVKKTDSELDDKIYETVFNKVK